MIVLVTGSRDWPEVQRVVHILDFVWSCCSTAGDGLAPEPLTVRHGGNGVVDTAAHYWALNHHYVGRPAAPDAMPADWKQLGKRAGGIRNQAMVDKGGIDLCIAFSYCGSSGTADCAGRAREADIPVWFHDFASPTPDPPPARLVTLDRWRAWQ